MQLVKGLHDKGYALRDFAERNVVCRKGNYRLIDFDDIETHDSCDWDGDLHFNESTPTSEVCRYMLERGLDMHFWPVRMLSFLDPLNSQLTWLNRSAAAFGGHWRYTLSDAMVPATNNYRRTPEWPQRGRRRPQFRIRSGDTPRIPSQHRCGEESRL